MARNFIDISNHQSGIRVANVPTDALIVKATEGRGFRDKSMPGFVSQARSGDKPLGFYHYVSQGNTPQQEADNFIGYTDGHRRDNDVMVLDWEPIGSNPGTGNVDWARRFLEHMTGRIGNPVWTYMNLSTANASNWKPVTGRWPLLWLAHYPGNNRANGYNPAGSRGNLNGSNGWQLAAWQFTDGGRLNGYSGSLDLNQLYTPWWEGSRGGGGTTVVVPDIPPLRENDPPVHLINSHGTTLRSSNGNPRLACVCMALTFPLIEKEMIKRGLIKHSIDVFQGAYNKGVGNSAGTHDMGGVIDVAQGITLDQRRVWAMFGVMMFPRVPQYGWSKGDHGHGVWHGCPHQMAITDRQVTSGMNGFDGLVGNARRNFEAPTRVWQDAYREHAREIINVREEEEMPDVHITHTEFDYAGGWLDDDGNPVGHTLVFEDGKGWPDVVAAVPVASRSYKVSAQITADRDDVQIRTRYVFLEESAPDGWHRHMETVHATHSTETARAGEASSALLLDIWVDKPCRLIVGQQAEYFPA